jgi:hypothetical protein
MEFLQPALKELLKNSEFFNILTGCRAGAAVLTVF